MQNIELILASADETRSLGLSIGRIVAEQSIFALMGPLGAGKTSLVQGIGEALGINEPIVSPTFTMLNEYHSGRLPLYHIDLYRIADDPAAQVAEGGESLHFLTAELDELIGTNGIILIEWAEHLLPYLPQDYVLARLDYLQDRDGRTISLLGVGERSSGLIAKIKDKIFCS